MRAWSLSLMKTSISGQNSLFMSESCATAIAVDEQPSRTAANRSRRSREIDQRDDPLLAQHPPRLRPRSVAGSRIACERILRESARAAQQFRGCFTGVRRFKECQEECTRWTAD